MEESKWCPPMAANCDMPHCEREGCAWWINGRCVIVAIAENLKKLNNAQAQQ